MNKIKQFWHETDSIEMVLFATLWGLFGYGAYVVILALIDRVGCTQYAPCSPTVRIALQPVNYMLSSAQFRWGWGALPPIITKGNIMNLEELAVMTPKKFAIKIEEIVKEGGSTYMDAILDYCERHQMDLMQSLHSSQNL